MGTKEASTNLGEIFYVSLVKQIRAIDSYGSYAKYSDDELISLKFIKQADADVAKADQMAQSIKLYLQTLAVTLERISGQIITLMTETGCDGSVKSLFYSGQLIIMDKTFGGLTGLQYTSIDKLKDSGAKLLQRLQNIIVDKQKQYKDLLN